jgi:hypothetical protein
LPEPRLDLAGPSERLSQYAVLVTDGKVPLESVEQCHSERADCENDFNELKTQLHLSSFTTHDINRCLKLKSKSMLRRAGRMDTHLAGYNLVDSTNPQLD